MILMVMEHGIIGVNKFIKILVLIKLKIEGMQIEQETINKEADSIDNVCL